LSKRVIKIRFQNGLTLEGFKKEVFDLYDLTSVYQFEESAEPDFVVFGPYGNDIPRKGNYTRIGYFCENIKPDLSICEWAFGIPREQEIGRPNYTRIQWHGINPKLLIKPASYDPEKILASKTAFCNFLYSNKVSYREAFLKQLCEYKKVDAPGISMNNMPGIDSVVGDRWATKRQFLSAYKFTIAFENDIYPGYQTEKLYDAMMADSIPIYCGDPYIGDIFNTKSFINAPEYLPSKNLRLIKKLTKLGQMDFNDIRPAFFNAPNSRLKRKMKSYIRAAKAKLRFATMNFAPLVNQVIALDRNPGLYMQYLEQPWLKNNAVPENLPARKRWMEIFDALK